MSVHDDAFCKLAADARGLAALLRHRNELGDQASADRLDRCARKIDALIAPPRQPEPEPILAGGCR